MAVPKKRTSKSKSKSRKSIWMNKASSIAKKSLAIAKSLMTSKSTNFIYTKSFEDYK
uniref:Large ribosomal subunit protein bL32c n=1 Tax=Polysiphonia sertularioides TaxID=945028 RepID=A0A1Z1M8K4_9FLOR|nr:ribosomal protein L32 [Polysiphonia sertularioides]ARW62408.1 ribosomal protein L32 [Polysiphonia sertularioides]